MVRRRDILAILALLAAPVAAFRLASRETGDELSFAPIEGLPGFRRLDTGPVSTGAIDPLIGLSVPGAAPAPPPLPAAALCALLFGPVAAEPGTVPVAAFSDYFCPYCRDLTRRLAARDGQGVRIAWHELPILGDASLAAARAALAADLQGAYPAFQERLMRAAFRPTTAYLEALSDGLGLDTGRFLADMENPGIDRRLAESRAAADRLGIAATPALVVGRTLVTGAIADARLDALLDLERAAGPAPC